MNDQIRQLIGLTGYVRLNTVKQPILFTWSLARDLVKVVVYNVEYNHSNIITLYVAEYDNYQNQYAVLYEV